MLGLSFLLLLVAFRSLLVPIQAAVTNLISVGAAFGILTAAFQWGWALPFIGPDSPYGTVPIASYVPLMMFAALFGLSMDYEVFFVSSVQGHHLGGEDARAAVRSGLASSAQGHRRGGGHHDLRLRLVHPERGPDHQAVRCRPLGGCSLAGVWCWRSPRLSSSWRDDARGGSPRARPVLPHMDVEGAGAQAKAPVESMPSGTTAAS